MSHCRFEGVPFGAVRAHVCLFVCACECVVRLFVCAGECVVRLFVCAGECVVGLFVTVQRCTPHCRFGGVARRHVHHDVARRAASRAASRRLPRLAPGHPLIR